MFGCFLFVYDGGRGGRERRGNTENLCGRYETSLEQTLAAANKLCNFAKTGRFNQWLLEKSFPWRPHELGVYCCLTEIVGVVTVVGKDVDMFVCWYLIL